MPATVLQPMARIFLAAFRDRAAPPVLWIRHDDPTPVSIPALFNAEYAPVDLSGAQIADARPTLSVAVADAQRLAPGRPLKSVFDNRDFIIVGGVSYGVSDCEPDGGVMISVPLYAK
ncbi:hypothetical protein [Aureimonas sp. SK2]|uniref:head-tail joining protein n=1 Tax=Aureimonas sp. SK2 TaxID=3015992 RepID=UPI0024439099|nr:hypothetical protein [Aureimonas sp. SK2]